MRWKAAIGAAGVIGLGVAADRWFAAPRYRGPVSDHFDGERFHNHQSGWQSEGSFLRWQMNRSVGRWPRWIDASPGPPPPRRVGNGALRLTWINHATMLIQMDGVNILTDPIWSERCSPIPFAGPKRHRPPGLRFQDLPPIDAVLISHNHYDHMDVPTLRRFVRSPYADGSSRVGGVQEGGSATRDPEVLREHATRSSDPRFRAVQPQFFVPLGNAALLARHDIRGAMDLDWWEERSISEDVRVTLVPAQHFCARAISDRNATLWGGFVISGPSGNVYFAGDTGWGKHFDEIRSRAGEIRLAMLPIGAYLPRWFMKPAHISPAEAVDAHCTLGARTSVAMHFGTFLLGDDGYSEPVVDLRTALAEKGSPRVLVLEHGVGFDVP